MKDALDKEAVCRCMTACYEMHQAEKKKKMEGLTKGPDGSYLQSAKTLAAFGGSLLQGVVVSRLAHSLFLIHMSSISTYVMSRVRPFGSP